MDRAKRWDLFLFWVRRTIDRHFDKLLLAVLIGVSIAISVTFRLLLYLGRPELDQLNNGWLREQTALLIGALLGLIRGESKKSPPDDTTP